MGPGKYVQRVSLSFCVCLHSNDFDVGLDPDISLADMYRWKVSAYAPCSSTCTTGKHMNYMQLHQSIQTHTDIVFN